MKIIEAQNQHFDIVRVLFREYKDNVSEDGGHMCFGGFAEELANLPSAYASPKGVIYLAFEDDNEASAIGCVAIRPRENHPEQAEIKRLFVRSNKRSSGAGRQLLESGIEFSKNANYKRMFLETVASMKAAKSLYQRYGFIATNTPPQGEVECFEYVFNHDAENT